MILIHITPVAKDLPWCIEAIEITKEFGFASYFNAKIKLPYGVFPNPNYVLALPQSYVESIKNEPLNYFTLGNNLRDLLAKHDTIIFSHQESFKLFKKITNMLLLEDLLVNKKIISLKSMINVGVNLRNLYPQNINSIKALGAYLGINEDTLGKTSALIMQDLSRRNLKLLNYFLSLNNGAVFPDTISLISKNNNTNNPSFKITLGVTDNDLKIVCLLKQIKNGYIALNLDLNTLLDEVRLDIKLNAQKEGRVAYNEELNINIYDYMLENPDLLINNYLEKQLFIIKDPFLLSPINTITVDLLNKKHLDAQKLTNLINLLNEKLGKNPEEFTKFINKSNLIITKDNDETLNLYPNYNNLDNTYLSVAKLRDAPQVLSEMIPTLGEKLRTLALDYCFAISSNQSEMLINAYNDLVTIREAKNREDFMRFFEIALAKDLNDNERMRLDELIEYYDS